MVRQLPLRSLALALERFNPSAGLIHHSDQGTQYASNDYQALLARLQIVPSMNRKGNCYDNIVIESSFSTLKCEEVERRNYNTRKEATREINLYIEQFYNNKRRHSSLHYKTPAEAIRDFQRA